MEQKLTKYKKKAWFNDAFSRAFNRHLKMALLITLVLCTIDFFGRVSPSLASQKSMNISKVEVQLEPHWQLDEAMHEQYLKKLSSFLVSAPEVAAALDIASDSSPEGDYWHSDMHKYKLQGIFRGGKMFAILERISKSDSRREILQLSVGDAFDGFTVDSISPMGVLALGPSGENLKLALFEPEA